MLRIASSRAARTLSAALPTWAAFMPSCQSAVCTNLMSISPYQCHESPHLLRLHPINAMLYVAVPQVMLVTVCLKRRASTPRVISTISVIRKAALQSRECPRICPPGLIVLGLSY